MGPSLTILSVLAAALSLAASPNRKTELRVAQYPSDHQISVGNILVASENLGDPNFAETVILIVQYDADDGVVGLILNRRTQIPLARIFPKVKHASADPAFMGGPVEITAGQALLRLPAETEQATHVMGDIYVTGTKDLIEKSVAARMESSKFRLYLGYAGWAPQQLEAEIRLGAWSVLGLRPKIVFDDNPDSLWSRLTHESHMQIARSLLLARRFTAASF